MSGSGEAPADRDPGTPPDRDPGTPPDRDPATPSDRDPATPAVRDEMWMARALEIARVAGRAGEVPVGAVVVREGRLVAEAHNRTVTDTDPTAHAEVVVIRKAARRLGDWRLTGSTLYATLEPCALCAGALVLARVDRLVYGAPDPKAGMAGSLENLVQDDRLNHRVELRAGVLAGTSADLLRGFFRERR